MGSFLKKYTKTRRNKLLPQELQLRFLKRLVRLLENGYSLLEALEIIKWDKQLIPTALIVKNAFQDGKTIDEAFEVARFHKTIIAYLFFVRENGDLITSIKKCIAMYEHRLTYIQKFKQITRYPLILLFFFAILLYFIKQSVLPSFESLFHVNNDASAIVHLLLLVMDYLTLLLMLLSIILLGLCIFWFFYKRKIKIENQIKIYNYIPIYRKFLRLHTSFLFATHLSSLLKTGISMKKILTMMSSQQKLPIVSYYTYLMKKEVTNGLELSPLLAQLPLFEKQLSSIFQKSNDIDALEKDLSLYADLLMEEIERKVMKVITYIQPIFFVILACFIVFIYVTLMWPMFQLIKTI